MEVWPAGTAATARDVNEHGFVLSAVFSDKGGETIRANAATTEHGGTPLQAVSR